MDEKVFISRQSWLFFSIVNMIKVFFPICTLTWRVNNNLSRKGKGINKRKESTIIIMIIVYHCTDLTEQFCSTQLNVTD